MTRAPGAIHRFAELIERPIQESDRSSIATFNDLPPQMLQEARLVRKQGGRFPACEYLRFFVDKQDGGDAESFCEEVLEDGADAATWRIEDCLIGVVEQQREGLGLTVDGYIAGFDGVEGERWFRDCFLGGRPDEIPISSVGPGVLIRAVHYWTPLAIPKRKPSLRVCVIDPKYCIVERIPDSEIAVAIRRWMATLAAWWTRDYLMADAPRATVEGILGAYPVPVTPSADGLVALRALVQEARSGDPRWPGQVGYIGPDAWYRP